MSKKLDFKLTDSELLQIAEAIHADMRPEVRKHAAAIQLLANGQEPTDVARGFAVQPMTIYSWFHRFRRDGYEGLANQPRGRPKRKADQFYCQALEAAIKHDPGDYGYAFTTWTVEHLRDHLEKMTGVHLSTSRLHMLIRKQGYTNLRLRRGLISLQDLQAMEQTQDDQRGCYLELIRVRSDGDPVARALPRITID
jgi:putative transposase